MLYKALSAAVYGIDANIIEVEVDVSGVKMNQDHFHTVGLPDAAVRESRDRVRSAQKNCGYDISPTRLSRNASAVSDAPHCKKAGRFGDVVRGASDAAV